jgi:hypothetical protein
MGMAARKNYLASYTPERNYQQLIQIYHEAVDSAPLPLTINLTHAETRDSRQ